MRIRSSRTNQTGTTLIELIVVMAIGVMLLGATAAYSVQRMAEETMRAAAEDLQAFLQLTKMEAISRNRECFFIVDRANGMLEVWDAAGTPADLSDDRMLHTRPLPQSVRFARPDQNSGEITMAAAGSNRFRTMFTSDGIVTGGVGTVYVHGGDRFGRITVYVAGGVEVEYWNGTTWENAS